MFDTKTLKATPGLARRLLAFSAINGMTFDQGIAELAGEELVDPLTLQNLPWKIDGAKLAALQHIMDWRGRAMLLECGNERSREVALASAHLRGGKTLILAQPVFYVQWARLIREAWPTATISVFGNPRYAPKDVVYPQGIEFSDRPDLEADFLITSYGGIIWHDLVGNLNVNQTIVEELDNNGSINHKWNDAVTGMFHELPAPLFIQNVFNLPADNGRDNMASLQVRSSRALQYMGQLVHTLMWAGTAVTRPLVANTLQEVDNYLATKGYRNMDLLELIAFYGVSSHLLEDKNGSKTGLTFFDSTIAQLRSSSVRNDSGLKRFIEREQDLKHQTGRSLEELVQSALDGDAVTQTLVGALMTSQWANLKSNHLKTIHTNMTNRLSRNLFLVENQDMKRNLRLQFGPVMDDLSTATDRRFTMARFFWPSNPLSLTPLQWQNIKGLGNLIVTLDDLITEPLLMETANFLFAPEWILDRETYQLIQAAADASGTRIVSSVLTGTVEEIIHRKLM